MIDLIINKEHIAFIFPQDKYWKIAFGKTNKKIFEFELSTQKEAINKAKKMGFGGYRIINNSAKNGIRFPINLLLNRKKWQSSPFLFD